MFDGRNLLHLQRFILGRQYNAMLLAVEYRDVVIDLKPIQLPMFAHQVPACIADRITCISEALILHARISQQLQIPFHTLGAAITAGSISLGLENMAPLGLVATATNRARHCDLDKVDLTCTEMDFEWAEMPAASLAAGFPYRSVDVVDAVYVDDLTVDEAVAEMMGVAERRLKIEQSRRVEQFRAERAVGDAALDDLTQCAWGHGRHGDYVKQGGFVK